MLFRPLLLLESNLFQNGSVACKAVGSVSIYMWTYLCLQEHRMEIDARGGNFQAFEMFGNQLLQNNHYASEEVKDRMADLTQARENLEQWVLRTVRNYDPWPQNTVSLTMRSLETAVRKWG